ncbi:MAG: NAD(P)-dependent oxidoreductase [Pirellulales bacterium]|nr:NAD(P)-dependent oxidoreductase [Pirellulales bacterium]
MNTENSDIASIDRIDDVEQLEEMLSRPTPGAIDAMRRLEGDILVLGVGGKIGPSLARMARRASDQAGVRRKIFGVARFSSSELQQQLESHGIETIRCNLLDRKALQSLPEAPNVLYLAAMKFGSSGQTAMTWAMNTYLPGMVAERYPNSRIVAYSTGNVYPMVPVDSSGSRETDALGPVGDYAMSCLGRERIFNHFSLQNGTPTALLRLNYAHECRYGVMVDIAQQILAGKPINLSMGYFNAIWQGDNNAITLRAFDHVVSPPFLLNLTGPEKFRVREVAEQIGEIMDRRVEFTGSEAPDALLSDASKSYELFGNPQVPGERFLQWIADWQARGGPSLGKPTKFQSRDGTF